MPEDNSQKVSNQLMHAGPRTSPEDAARLMREHYGIDGTAKLLSGERDENFRVQADGVSWLLKIAHPDEDAAVLNFQTRALLHVAAADPSLATPHVLQAQDGRYAVETRDGRVARVLSFLPGAMAYAQPRSPALRTGIGNALARFDRALGDFTDPADTYELSWDLVQALKLRPLVGNVGDPQTRTLAAAALDRFEAGVMPALPALRKQVIHNDLSLFNILVDEAAPERITGIIDFGDMVRAPLINDLAIASAYHVPAEGDALTPLLEIVAAYTAQLPITVQECALLPDLIAMRMAMTVLITEWRAKRHPENRAYILKNHPAATLGLLRLNAIPRAEADTRFRRAAKLEP